MNGQPVFLVACCALKRNVPTPAEDLYVSKLFRACRTYAARRGPWYILSALHGLVAPSTIIAPYELALSMKCAASRREWGAKVREQMHAERLLGRHLVALAGKMYVDNLLLAGVQLELPLQGLFYGQQLQWLERENRASTCVAETCVPNLA